ncbi:MAG: hypothetical protein Tsb0032_16730 [Kiloniellaceae bacterium]
MTLQVRLLVSLSPLLMFSLAPPAAAQECTGSPTAGFNCQRDDGNAAIGTVFSASEAGGRRNVSLTLIEDLVEEEAAPSGSGGGDPARGLELFASGGYGWHDYDTENVLGQDGDSFSGMVGASYRGDAFLVGLAVDMETTDSDIASDGGSKDSDEYGAQLFGTVFPFDNFFVSGGARIAMLDIDTTRSIDSTSNVARGDTDGMKYGLTGGVGYNLPVTDATVVSFSGWLAWERTEVDGYTESGASAVGGGSADAPNLAFDDDNFNTLDGILRVEVAHAVRVGSALIVPSARFDYVHEFESDSRTINAALEPTDNNDPQFDVIYRTNDADENYFRVGASLTAAFDQGTSITAGYSGDFGHSWREEHLILIGLSHRF